MIHVSCVHALPTGCHLRKSVHICIGYIKGVHESKLYSYNMYVKSLYPVCYPDQL